MLNRILKNILKNIIIILYLTIGIFNVKNVVVNLLIFVVLFIVIVNLMNRYIRNCKETNYLDVLYFLIVWAFYWDNFMKVLNFYGFLILILIWKKYGFKEFILKLFELYIKIVISYLLIVYFALTNVSY